jgi:hypothetical protein
MKRQSTSWFQLSWDMMQLTVEANSVIALRTIKMATGGAGANEEVSLMVSEKVQAAMDAQFEMAKALMAGRVDGPSKAVALYRRRVRANQKRLTGGQ